MWTDYYLRAPTQATFEDSIPPDGFRVGMAMDVVGDLSTPAWTDPDTGDMHAARTVAGWHVNVRCAGVLPTVLEAFVIAEPVAPKRVWAQ